MSLAVKLSLSLHLTLLQCQRVISVKSLQSGFWLCKSTYTTIDRTVTLFLSHLHLLIKPGKGLACETDSGVVWEACAHTDVWQ